MAAAPHFASASLYVGDLAPEVNETTLFEVFNAIGPVASIRVCRESGTRRSLGYAYVNYHSVHDAERALDTLNFSAIKGNPCRIMWSHRDPSLRKSGSGNIFVKNLDKSIDNKSLYDTFSLFGNILSCKVATDEFGKSRGHGFVHYETEESAKAAVEKVNGILIGAKNVYVGPFKKRTERQTTRSKNFTNLYVKHFPECWNDETLRRVFGPFGEIASQTFNTDSKGRRFAFVDYGSCDSARAAVAELHGKRVSDEGIAADQSNDDKTEEKKDQEKKDQEKKDQEKKDQEKNGEEKVDQEQKDQDKKGQENGQAAGDADAASKSSRSSDNEDSRRLYVQRAMTKAERIALLKEQFSNNVEKQKQQQQQGVNLYVKNLDDQVTDEGLSEAFSKYGTVTSAKIMRDESGASKGFGFVCFAFPDDATKAVTAMHLRLFMGKPLYVGLAEKRDHRIARLQQRFRTAARPNAGPMMIGGHAPQHPQLVQPFGPPPQVYFGGSQALMNAQQRSMPGPGFVPPGGAWRQQQPAPRSYGPAFQMNPPMASAGTPMYPYHQQQMGPEMNPLGSNPAANSAMMMRGIGEPRPRYGGMQQQQQGGHMGAGGAAGLPNFKFTPQARNRDYPQSQHHHAGGQMQQQQPVMNDATMLTTPGDLLSAQSLAAAHPQMQKQMLGEKLFPLVAKRQPELAGKITGMMLEMDNGELLSLLESETQLQAKVDEALGVLHRHQAIGPSQQQHHHQSAVNPAA